MSRQELLVMDVFREPRLAKPGIPLEKPKRRSVPDVPYPMPSKPIPIEPIKTPSEPVPVRR